MLIYKHSNNICHWLLYRLRQAPRKENEGILGSASDLIKVVLKV